MTDHTQLFSRIAKVPIVPVLVVEDITHAVPLAETLAESGLTSIEVTLRTEKALDVISAMKAAVPQMMVGAGTVLNESDLNNAVKAGSDFVVTPATTPKLLDALLAANIASIPGISTAGEALGLLELGFTKQKFFPAEASGGAAYLKAISGPMPQISFMPTGGVKKSNLSNYLELPSVFAIGGTWIVKPDDLLEQNWSSIGSAAMDAIASLNRV